MTREEMLARGLRAKRLLADEDVQAAIQDVRNALTAEFQQARRDDLLEPYYKNKALTLLLAQLESWRNDALIEERR